MNVLARGFVTVTLSLALVAGCRGRNGDGGNGDGTPPELTADQQAAVDAVVEQLEATAKAFGGVVQSFSGGLDADGDGTVGECPVVTATFENGTTNVSVDFGDTACTSDYYDNPVSGAVSLSLNRQAGTVVVDFNDLSVDSVTTAGSANLNLTRQGATRILTGSINLTTTGVGSVSGTLDVTVDVGDLTLAVDDADLSIADEDGANYSVNVDGIFIDPVTNGNFIPESGTVTFEIPNEGPGPETTTIVIEFDETSPDDGSVAVSVGGAEPIEYDAL